MNSTTACILLYTLILIGVSLMTMFVVQRVPRSATRDSIIVLNVIEGLWLLFSGLYETATTHSELLLWTKLAMLPIAWIGFAIFILFIYHSQFLSPYIKRGQLHAYSLFLLFLIPTVCMLPLLFGSFDKYYFAYAVFYEPMFPRFGPFFYFILSLNYAMVFMGSIILLKQLVIQGWAKKKSNFYLFLSVFIPLMISYAQFHLTEQGYVDMPFDITPVYFAIYVVFMTYLVLFKKTYGKMLYGREFFMFSAEAAVILDKYNRIVERNHAFQKSFKNVKEIHDLFIEMDHSSILLDHLSRGDTQFSKFAGQHVKTGNFYNVVMIAIRAGEWDEVIKVITFNDVTEFYKAQRNAFIEQYSEKNARLALLLHDQLGHWLTMSQRKIEKLLDDIDYIEINGFSILAKEALCCVRKTHESVRQMSKHLSDFDSIQSISNERNRLSRLESTFKDDRSIVVSVKLMGFNGRELIKTIDEELYWICIEAISNACRHGAATHIRIFVKVVERSLKLKIIDNGNGVDNLVDLKSIRRRASTLDGDLSYGSPEEGGFFISLMMNDCELWEAGYENSHCG